MTRVLIRGDGIAARCCEHLLLNAGCEVSAQRPDRARLPAIMLSDAAISLIEGVFDRKGVFNGLHRIRKRVVAWGAAPVTLEHSAGVVSELQLLDLFPGRHLGQSTDADWFVLASHPPTHQLRFGSRTARAIPVRLKGGGDTCWIESLDEGWLFLIPTSDADGWLLAVGGAPHILMAQSRLVAEQIEEMTGDATEFPAYPRIVAPISHSNWLACGSAATAFDPICGDGTANAVREAILASAVIRAGTDSLPHYEARLIAGFQKHLAMCVPFYQCGGSSAWWQTELAALQEGLDWCAQRMNEFSGYRYQLRGFDLVKLT